MLVSLFIFPNLCPVGEMTNFKNLLSFYQEKRLGDACPRSVDLVFLIISFFAQLEQIQNSGNQEALLKFGNKYVKYLLPLYQYLSQLSIPDNNLDPNKEKTIYAINKMFGGRNDNSNPTISELSLFELLEKIYFRIEYGLKKYVLGKYMRHQKINWTTKIELSSIDLDFLKFSDRTKNYHWHGLKEMVAIFQLVLGKLNGFRLEAELIKTKLISDLPSHYLSSSWLDYFVTHKSNIVYY